MSTCNFIIQNDFDVYVAIYEKPSDRDIEAYEKEEQCKYNYEFENDFFYHDNIENFNFLIDDFLKQKNKTLKYFKPKIKSGYYDGIQTFFEFNNNYYDSIYDIDNEAAHCYYNVCRSKAIKEYESEKNFINKKLLPYISENSDFKKINCIGVFSNGEGIYEYAM